MLICLWFCLTYLAIQNTEQMRQPDLLRAGVLNQYSELAILPSIQFSALCLSPSHCSCFIYLLSYLQRLPLQVSLILDKLHSNVLKSLNVLDGKKGTSQAETAEQSNHLCKWRDLNVLCIKSSRSCKFQNLVYLSEPEQPFILCKIFLSKPSWWHFICNKKEGSENPPHFSLSVIRNTD